MTRMYNVRQKARAREQIDDKEIYNQVNAEECERARLKCPKAKQQGKASIAAEPSLASADDETDDIDDWKSRLLASIGDMTPDGLEYLSQRLLREAGFIKVGVRGRIDGVGVRRVTLVPFQVRIQFKRWKGSVGSKEIRDFRGGLQSRADESLFITTGSFTADSDRCRPGIPI